MVPTLDIVQALEEARASSELVREVQAARALYGLLEGKPAALRKAGYRPLTPAELRALKAQGNSAQDWSEVRVGKGFDPKRVSRCHFAGPVLISSCAGSVEVEGVSFPTGLAHATLANSVLGRDVLVRNTRLLNRTVVRDGAVLFDVGAVTKGPSDSFANGETLAIAIETGGREVPIFAELTVDGAWCLARSRSNLGLLQRYAEGVASYRRAVSAPFNVIGPQARLTHTPRLADVFLGAAAVVEGAGDVENVTVLSHPDEKSRISRGAIVRSSILQWGAEVTTGAIVDTSLLAEHSHAERHGKVTHSIIGPNSGVAEGEVTSALLGPFVGFHHQALLIAALWPEGKGNVGYGANVGSNHTAKAPDQEIWPGEGAFFGLGVNVKFPTDLTRSPYTIIASGVSMLPQKLEFPFSLINTPAALTAPGISPAYNELFPAWVLSDNVYMVKRNEGKYQKRNQSRRSRFDFEVFRPEIVDLMADARRRLQAAPPKEVYTSKEVPGLGKNYMSEASRKRAIETYTFYIRYYALLGLKRELSAMRGLSPKGTVPAEISRLLKSRSSNARWEHERQILVSEFLGVPIPDLLRQLVEAQEKVAAQVQASKEKDDRRGAEIIEDYDQAHRPAREDPFVKETWALTAKLKEEVQGLLRRNSRKS